MRKESNNNIIFSTTLLPEFCLLNINNTHYVDYALRIHQKHLNLCSEDERRSYGFGTTWGGVINDRIFIFGWTVPLMKSCWSDTIWFYLKKILMYDCLIRGLKSLIWAGLVAAAHSEKSEPQASWSVLEDRVPLGVSGSGRVVRVSSQTRVRENDLVGQRLQAVVDDDHLQRLMGGEIPQRSWETQETHFTRTRTNNDSISRLDLGCFDSCGLSMKHWWNYNIQFNSIQFTLTDW